jgi:hypothetical protein
MVGGARIERSSIVNNAGAGTSTYNLELVDSIVSENGGHGVGAPRLQMLNSQVSSNGSLGISAIRVRAESSEVSGNGDVGIRAKSVDMISGTVSGNGSHGIVSDETGGKLKLTDSSVANNGEAGVSGFKTIRTTRSSLTGNGTAGIVQSDASEVSARVLLVESTVTGNGLFGVSQELGTFRGLALKASSVSGNGVDVSCGSTAACADLGSPVEPRLRSESSCGSSYVYDSGIPGDSWAVCADD